MASHVVKSTPPGFEALWRGQRRAEWRRNDRGYAAGDGLVMREWSEPYRSFGDLKEGGFASDPRTDGFTGREVRAVVLDVATGAPGMPDGYCLLTLDRLERLEDGRPVAGALNTWGGRSGEPDWYVITKRTAVTASSLSVVRALEERAADGSLVVRHGGSPRRKTPRRLVVAGALVLAGPFATRDLARAGKKDVLAKRGIRPLTMADVFGDPEPMGAW